MNVALFLPELTAVGFFLFFLIREILSEDQADAKNKPHAFVAMAGILLVLLALLFTIGIKGAAFEGTFILDPFAFFFKIFFTLAALVIFSMSGEFFKNRPEKSGAFFLVLWCTVIGLFFLVSAADLLLLFIALEVVALSFYILTAYLKGDLLSIEASVKYLVLGSLASAFTIYGISLVYLATGATSFEGVRHAFASGTATPLALWGILSIISGLGFKISSVPFQLWTPDVYEGAPTPAVAFLAIGSKAAGFAVFIRLLFTVFTPIEPQRAMLFSVLAAMTLCYGNLGALLQTNVKRLFGYSSIGHAGYILIGLAVGRLEGVTAALYYLIAYALANLAGFFVISLVGESSGGYSLDAFKGLSRRSPFLAGVLFISLLSLAGVPPLAGFFGKFLILLAAVRGSLGWLALLGLLFVAVSLYYYLTIVRAMYIETPLKSEPIPVSRSIKLLLAAIVAGIIVVGIWQAPFLHLSQTAAASLG